ncbi:unnamed protein product [Allacma fusca]|uniref:Uncharacterized protein n=1 Tax=Allacma fusca TaxID=39272 RepID=A0A8J2Q6R8_9HEXA|nr:unnamed protein product [Allacma fusca]
MGIGINLISLYLPTELLLLCMYIESALGMGTQFIQVKRFTSYYITETDCNEPILDSVGKMSQKWTNGIFFCR